MMTEDNDLFGIFDNDAEHASTAQSKDAQLERDITLHNDESAPPLPPMRRKQVREAKKKARRKRRMRIVSSILAIILVVLIGIAGYKVVQKLHAVTQAGSSKTSQVLDYPGPGTGLVTFTVDEGEGTAQIAQNLVDEGIVRSVGAFTKAVQVADAANKLQAGSFELKKKMAAADVVAIITDASKITGSLIVKSGETVSQIISAASKLSGIDESEFTSIINGGGSSILPSSANGKFEGWFEPGTYNVKSSKSASDIISAMVQKRVKKLQELGVSEDQYETVLIKSSIVEAEVNKSDYYGKVARVIENRLSANMPLGMDSVIAYGAGVKARDLTVSQLSDSSNIYNDRIYTGLPPTPINNPGDAAIKAVLSPESGNWLYFVTVNLDTGETKFTDSETEFEQYSKEYQEWEANN